MAVFPVPCMSSYTLTPSLVLTDYTNVKLSSNTSGMISLVDSFLFPVFVIKCASATFYLSLIDHKTLTLYLSYHAAKCRNIAHSLALCWVKSENSSLTFAALIKQKNDDSIGDGGDLISGDEDWTFSSWAVNQILTDCTIIKADIARPNEQNKRVTALLITSCFCIIRDSSEMKPFTHHKYDPFWTPHLNWHISSY